MTDEYMSSAEIREKIAELKIKLAFQMEFEEELNETLAECEMAEMNPEQLTASEEREILRQIEDNTRKSVKNRRCKESFLRIGRLAMILFIAVSLSVGGALAAIHMVKKGILRLDYHVYEEYTSYELVKTQEYIEVPQDWEGDFYPTYIPEGFAFCSISSMGVCYMNDEGSVLVFDENLYGGQVKIDTEAAELSAAHINGSEAMIVEKDGIVTVIWSANNRCFVIELQGAKEEALRVATSVTLLD